MAKLEPFKFVDKNGDHVTLRSPEVGEGEKILRVVQAILKTSDHLMTEPDEFSYTIEQEDQMISRHLEHPDKIVIVPEVSGQIVGMMDFSVGSRRRNSHAGEFGLSLMKEYRGRGIASKMLDALIQWAGANPRIEKVNLRVHAKNIGAIALYERRGFSIFGREVRGVKLQNSYDDLLMMTRFV